MRTLAMSIALALVGTSCVASACAENKRAVVLHGTTAMKADKGVLGSHGEPPAFGTAPSPWPNFYGPTPHDFDRAHLSAPLRRKVLALVGRIPLRERLYARWLPWQGGVIVFEVRPDQIRSDGRGYSPSTVLNEPNLYVDPTNGNVFAGPP